MPTSPPGSVGAHFEVGRSAFLDVAQVGNTLQLDRRLLELLGQLDDHVLHQCGTANSLLHPQLAAFHAACQIDLALARQ